MFVRFTGEVERLLRDYRQNQELVRNIGANYYQIIYPVQIRHHDKMGISTREVGSQKVSSGMKAMYGVGCVDWGMEGNRCPIFSFLHIPRTMFRHNIIHMHTNIMSYILYVNTYLIYLYLMYIYEYVCV